MVYSWVNYCNELKAIQRSESNIYQNRWLKNRSISWDLILIANMYAILILFIALFFSISLFSLMVRRIERKSCLLSNSFASVLFHKRKFSYTIASFSEKFTVCHLNNICVLLKYAVLPSFTRYYRHHIPRPTPVQSH